MISGEIIKGSVMHKASAIPAKKSLECRRDTCASVLKSSTYIPDLIRQTSTFEVRIKFLSMLTVW